MKSSAVWLYVLLRMMSVDPSQAQNAVTGCGQPDCIGCGEDDLCTRCTRAIVHGTRQCVSACPGNYRLVHSDVEGYQGLLCRAQRFLDTADMTVAEMSALVAALLLAAVCIGLAIGAYMYLRLRRKMDPLREQLHRKDPDLFDLERVQYLARLRTLRPEMRTFLEILNEPRPRSVLSSGDEGRHSSRGHGWSHQDLRRVLVLLSRKEQLLGPAPPDWDRLLSGAERLLRQHRQQRALDKSLARHILAVPGAGAALRRPRSAAAGRLSAAHTSRDGSFFSLSQTVIEEEEDDDVTIAGGASSLPPSEGRRHQKQQSRRPTSANNHHHLSRRRERRARRNRRAERGRGGLGSRRWPADRPNVYVHRLNGGHGGSLWGPRPGSAAGAATYRPHSAPLVEPGVRSASAPLSQLNSLGEERPTYRDWRSRHFGGTHRPRPRPRHRKDDTWTRRSPLSSTLPLPSSVPGGGERASSTLERASFLDLPPGGFEANSAGSGFSAGSAGAPVVPASPLRWTRPDGGRTQHSDRLESDSVGGFSGRYLHPHDLNTVL